MSNGRKLALLAGVTLVLGLTPMLPASAGVVFNERIPIDRTLFNSCTGEFVHVTGEQYVVITEVGRGCFAENEYFHLTGVGQTSGLKYVLNANAHSTLCDPDPATCGFTGTAMGRQWFISQGSADNEVIVITQTVTENPDCSFHVDTELELECRG
jgi:hypothetical protein